MKFYQSLNETVIKETFLRASGASEDAEWSPVPPLISGLTVAYGHSLSLRYPENFCLCDLYLLTFKQEKLRKF